MKSFGLHVDIWEQEEADALPFMRAFLTSRRGQPGWSVPQLAVIARAACFYRFLGLPPNRAAAIRDLILNRLPVDFPVLWTRLTSAEDASAALIQELDQAL